MLLDEAVHVFEVLTRANGYAPTELLSVNTINAFPSILPEIDGFFDQGR